MQLKGKYYELLQVFGDRAERGAFARDAAPRQLHDLKGCRRTPVGPGQPAALFQKHSQVL